MPVVPLPNYAYKNNRDLTFEDATEKWGLKIPSFSNGCAYADLALDDIYWWKKNLTAGLPSAATTTTSVVVVPATDPSKMATVTVTISWSERNKDSAGSVAKTYTSSANICTEIPC
jgi:hypothetical protein